MGSAHPTSKTANCSRHGVSIASIDQSQCGRSEAEAAGSQCVGCEFADEVVEEQYACGCGHSEDGWERIGVEGQVNGEKISVTDRAMECGGRVLHIFSAMQGKEGKCNSHRLFYCYLVIMFALLTRKCRYPCHNHSMGA